MNKGFKIGQRVQVVASETGQYSLEQAAKKLGTPILKGTIKSGYDPCCGCRIIQFDANLGTKDTFYLKGTFKVGHLEEVDERFVNAARRGRMPKAPKPLRAPRALHVQVGDIVEVVKTDSDYPAVKVGDMGVVVVNSPDSGRVGVRWQSESAFKHTLESRVDDNHGYWVPYSMVKVTTDPLAMTGRSLKVGDRVIAIERKPDMGYQSLPFGGIGTVRKVNHGAHKAVGVEFDDFEKGHNLDGTLASGSRNGYYVMKSDLALIKKDITVEEPEKPKAKVEGDHVRNVNVRTTATLKATNGTPVKPGYWSAAVVTISGRDKYLIIPFGGSLGDIFIRATEGGFPGVEIE